MTVAAVNGPSSVVVSGERQVLAEFLRDCERDGVRVREVPADYAAHSAAVQEIREELVDGCVGIMPRRSNVSFFSTVTGGSVDTSALDGEYWYRNLREVVQFEQATRVLLHDRYRAFIEISPHPVLTAAVQETVEDALAAGDANHDAKKTVIAHSLRRDERAPECFLRSLAELWVGGVDVDWAGVFRGSGALRVKLPTYAFQRERYWLSSH